LRWGNNIREGNTRTLLGIVTTSAAKPSSGWTEVAARPIGGEDEIKHLGAKKLWLNVRVGLRNRGLDV